MDTILKLIYTIVVFLLIAEVLFRKITKPFVRLIERECCEGCGTFNHKLHDHYGYRSCSVECDMFLDEVFEEMQY